MAESEALHVALTLARAPSLAAAMRQQALPVGLDLVMRVAAGDAAALAEAQRLTGAPQADLRAAAESYLQRVLLYPGAPAHRVLGVAPGAPRSEIRAHLKLLMGWLHPDRNGGAWRAQFASRVLAAWRELSREAPALVAAAAPVRVAASPPLRSGRRYRAEMRPPHLPWIAEPLPRAGGRRRRLAWVAGLAAVLAGAVGLAGGDALLVWADGALAWVAAAP